MVGFLIAAPVGPVGLLCIRRALADGRGAAFIAGLGAAVADTFYGAVAGLGLTLISDFLMRYRDPLSIIGAVFLLVLGWRAWKSPPPTLRCAEGAAHLGLLKDFTVTLSITLTNPATILAFMAVFASLGAIHPGDDPLHSTLMIIGVFIGSALWWLTLSALASAVRHRFTERWLSHLNQASGGLLVLSAVGILLSVWW
ncbi:LysE family translocator [Insolitispirillum peregrinum]|uniref:Threonine/homoserine/homoserine lactone efflux protein n=1 Tax=Insolitispirillum peregrinum TaxID=80876 RepID=A0A1N7L566_9PROT|nr:LysE family transporter [Insolitispirillum peregrinum]SIS68916.1 Threonine/homoserine/homoserine lactone efflux protein [Insolitispirillum peregrinum]